MIISKREFNNLVKNSKAYEGLLSRVITLECAQGIHTETERVEYTTTEYIINCLNCDTTVKHYKDDKEVKGL